MPECSYSNFLDRILLSCSIRGIMYTFCVLWVAPLYTFFFFFFFFFQKYTLFLKKKEKKEKKEIMGKKNILIFYSFSFKDVTYLR